MRYTTRITTIRVTEHSTLSGMTELGQFWQRQADEFGIKLHEKYKVVKWVKSNLTKIIQIHTNGKWWLK
jgi:hypothetical protein